MKNIGGRHAKRDKLKAFPILFHFFPLKLSKSENRVRISPNQLQISLHNRVYSLNVYSLNGVIYFFLFIIHYRMKNRIELKYFYFIFIFTLF